MKTREGVSIWLCAFVIAGLLVLALLSTLPALRFKKAEAEPVIEIDFSQWDEQMHTSKAMTDLPKPAPVRPRSVVRQSAPTEKMGKPSVEEMPATPEQQTLPEVNILRKLPEVTEIPPQAAVTEIIKSEKEVSASIPNPTPIYQLTSMPRFAHKVDPQYPESMRALGRESQVTLEVLIDATGKVRKVKILYSGGDAFDKAAESALLASAFIPGNVEGKPVAVLMHIPITFRFN